MCGPSSVTFVKVIEHLERRSPRELAWWWLSQGVPLLLAGPGPAQSQTDATSQPLDGSRASRGDGANSDNLWLSSTYKTSLHFTRSLFQEVLQVNWFEQTHVPFLRARGDCDGGRHVQPHGTARHGTARHSTARHGIPSWHISIPESLTTKW